MDLIRVGPLEIEHEGFAQLAADQRVANGGMKVGPVAVEDQPGTAPGHIQRDGPEVLGAVRLAAVFQECPEVGPAQDDGLFRSLHAEQ